MSKTTDYIIEERNNYGFDYLSGLKTVINIIKQHKAEYQGQIHRDLGMDALDRLKLEYKIEALNTVLLEWIKSK